MMPADDGWGIHVLCAKCLIAPYGNLQAHAAYGRMLRLRGHCKQRIWQ